IIKFKQNGEKYTIEREFTKSKEKTTVLIYNTGEDITKEIETGNAGRVLQPGYHFFGFNDAVYSNTVSIKQLASKTEDSLANEIRDKLINISTTADDSLSIENAVEELEQSIKDIGSNRAPTSDYGRSIKALDHLKEEKEKTLEFKGKYDEALELSTQLREQLNNKNREMEELGERLANAKLLEKINIYNKAREIKEKISQLQLSREEYKQYKDLSQDDYYESIKLWEDIKHLDKSIEENKELLSETNIVLEKLRENQLDQSNEDNEINIDYNRYEDLEEQIGKIQYREDKFGEKEFLKRDYDSAIKDKDRFKTFSVVGIVVAVIINALGIISLNFLLLILNIVLIPGILLAIQKKQNADKLIEKISYKIDEIEEEEVNINNKLKELEEEEDLILGKYKINSKRELSELYGDWKFESRNIDAGRKSFIENQEKRKKLIRKIEEVEKDKKDKLLSLDRNLNKNKSNSLDEFKVFLKKKDKYYNIITDIKTKDALLDKELGKYKLEDLEEDLRDYMERDIEIGETRSSDQLENDRSKKFNEISEVKADISAIGKRLDYLNRELKRLVEIDEEIERKENSIAEMDKKKKAIE